MPLFTHRKIPPAPSPHPSTSKLALLFALIAILIVFSGLFPVRADNYIHINQDFSLSIGYLKGDKDIYLQYEEGSLPGLNPSIASSTLFKASLELPWGLSLQGRMGNRDESDYLQLSYRKLGLTLGDQNVRMPVYGYNFSQMVEGICLSYGDPQNTSGVYLFTARDRSKYTVIEFFGDDTPGPYFLGHRDIISGTVTVYVSGQEQEEGDGPGSGDYYLDYENGFLYFNRVILEHEKVKVEYEYIVDSDALAGTLTGGMLAYPLGPVGIKAFVISDYLPLDPETVLQEAGYRNLTWGVSTRTELEDISFDNTLLVSDYEQYETIVREAEDLLEIEEGRYTYYLGKKPVLYESEEVYIEGEKLDRNLDYVVDYPKGKITFTYEMPAGTEFRVKYSYTLGGEEELAERKKGYLTKNRLVYQKGNLESTALISATRGDFVDLKTHKTLPEYYTVDIDNVYRFNQEWLGIFDLKYYREGDRYLQDYQAGFEIDKRQYDARLILSAERDIRNEGSDDELYLLGTLDLDLPASPRISFRKDLLNSGFAAGDSYSLELSGDLFFLSGYLKYLHGGEDYTEDLKGRLSYSFGSGPVRGFASYTSRLLFRNDFTEEPKQVHSMTGDFNYLGESYYLHGKAMASASSYLDLLSSSYNLQAEVGKDMGSDFMVSYQFHLAKEGTFQGGELTKEKSTTGHTLVLQKELTDHITTSLTYSEDRGSSNKFSRDIVRFTDRQAGLRISFDFDPLSLYLSYSYSDTGVNSELLESVRDKQEVSLGFDWYNERNLSISGNIFYTCYNGEDEKRIRKGLTLRPYMDLTPELRLWGEYRYTNMNKSINLYDAHVVEVGISYNLSEVFEWEE